PASGGRQPIQGPEELRVVARIGRIGTAVALGADTRPTIERVDLQPGVVGQRRQARQPSVVARLERGIRLEGLAGLLGLALGADVVERDELPAIQGEEVPQLAQLVSGTGGDDQSRPCVQRRTVAMAAAWA